MTWQQLQVVILLPFTVMVVIPAIILSCAGPGGMALLRPSPWNVLMLVSTAVPLAVSLLLFVTMGNRHIHRIRPACPGLSL